MKKIFLISTVLFLFIGCASGKGLFGGLFTVKAADTIKAADKITGVEKIADKAALVDTSKVTTKTETVTTSVGRDLSNDSQLMKDYISALKDNSKQQGKLYEKVILGLIGQMAVLIGLLGWAMKKSMNSGDADDRFKEKMLERKISEQKMDDKIEIAKAEVR